MKKLFLFLLLPLSGIVHSQVNLSSDLVLCMPINGNALDMSGNGNYGITMGNPTLVSDRNGVPNSAYRFNGSSDYIKIGGSLSLDAIENNSELTIAAWCNVHAWYQDWNVFSIANRYNLSNDYGWEYDLQAPISCSEQAFCNNYPATGTACGLTAAGTTTFGVWAHYAITYSKSKNLFSAYKDGALINSMPVNNVDLENTQNGILYIGYSPAGPDEYSNGDMDEIMIYNRALTAAEISALYTGTYSCVNRPTGIRETGAGEGFAGIYPNPGSDRLNLSVDPQLNLKEINVSLYAYDGRLLLSTTMPENTSGNYSVNINDLSPGIYIATVSSGANRQNIKFVKQ